MCGCLLQVFWPESLEEMSPKDWLEAWTKVRPAVRCRALCRACWLVQFEQSPVCAGDVAAYQSFVFWFQVVVNETMIQSANVLAQAQADVRSPNT